MLALGARGREFDSPKSPVCANIAQLVARCVYTAEVSGSNPDIRIMDK